MKRALLSLLLVASVSAQAQPGAVDLSAVARVWAGLLPDAPKASSGLADLEISLGAPVDPFLRLDAKLHFETGVSSGGHAHSHAGQVTGSIAVEEVKFTFNGLPGGFQLVAGRFLSEIGTLNGIHGHEFAFPEMPLALAENYGSHDGMMQDGLRLSWSPRLPWYLEFWGEGQAGLLQGPDRVVAGIENFFDLGPSAGLRVSGFALGESTNRLTFRGGGGGVKFKWRPPGSGFSLLFQGEVHLLEAKPNAFALLSADLGKSFTVSALAETAVLTHDHGAGAESIPVTTVQGALQWKASEFQSLRLACRFPFAGVNEAPLRVSLDFTALIGPHPTHFF